MYVQVFCEKTVPWTMRLALGVSRRLPWPMRKQVTFLLCLGLSDKLKTMLVVGKTQSLSEGLPVTISRMTDIQTTVLTELDKMLKLLLSFFSFFLLLQIDGFQLSFEKSGMVRMMNALCL